MSLFHVQQWYNNIIPGARSMAIAQLVDYRDQLMIGSLEGTLTVLDPGRDLEHRQEMSVIVEQQLGKPILQVSTGKLLGNYDQILIAALLPRSLIYFRLLSNEEESYRLEQIFEHKLPGEIAYNMCQGHFGRSHITQICVQSITGSLWVFEGENKVFYRRIDDCLHPGPIEYTTFSESMLLTSSAYLSSVRYNVLTTSTGAGGKAKKLNIDWTLNLGDTALDMTVIGILPIQPSIVVLCRRSVYCVTHGGTPRFMIRLQCVAMCMMIYNSNKDAGIQICVGTSTSTLLFYHDTKMLWSAQLPFVPVYINISSFSESLRCLLSILSDDSRVFIGYLGTEPSLFRMPVTESRFIDFEQRKKDMRGFEETIYRHSKGNADGGQSGVNNNLRVEISVNMDHKSMAYDVNENVPSATAVVSVLGVKDQVDVLFHGDIFAHRTNFAFSSREIGNIPITMFVKDCPVLDLRCQIMTITNSAEVLTKLITLPLQLVCREAPPQRTSIHKILLDSNMPSLEIGQLFPEFKQENQSSLGLQPYGSLELTVSIFISSKTNRYRLQSDSTNFLFVVFSELVSRIRQHQPEVKVHCPVPLHLFLTAINQHLQIEQKRDLADEHVKTLSIQMRHVESLLLNKIKSHREPFTSHTNALINCTYQELMSGLDKLMELQAQLDSKDTRSLRALLNLMKVVMELSGVHLPFDGRIMDGTDQNLSERLTQLMAGDSTTSDTSTNSAEEPATTISRLLVSFCERGSSLRRIADIPEEEEEEGEEERLEKEDKARKEAINKLEERFELVDLQSGSLPANFGSISHVQQ